MPGPLAEGCKRFGDVDEFGQTDGGAAVAACLSIAATTLLVVASACSPRLRLPPHTLVPVRALLTGLQATIFLLGLVWTHDASAGSVESAERRRLRAAYDFLGIACALCQLCILLEPMAIVSDPFRPGGARRYAVLILGGGAVLTLAAEAVYAGPPDAVTAGEGELGKPGDSDPEPLFRRNLSPKRTIRNPFLTQLLHRAYYTPFSKLYPRKLPFVFSSFRLESVRFATLFSRSFSIEHTALPSLNCILESSLLSFPLSG